MLPPIAMEEQKMKAALIVVAMVVSKTAWAQEVNSCRLVRYRRLRLKGRNAERVPAFSPVSKDAL